MDSNETPAATALEPVAHMYPSDLARFKTSETFATAYSVAVGSPDERTAPLFSQADVEDLFFRLTDALAVLEMVDKNHRIEAGEKGKAWSGKYVAEQVRRVLAAKVRPLNLPEAPDPRLTVLSALRHAEARVEKVIWIAGMLGNGTDPAEELKELLNESRATLKQCFPHLPEEIGGALCDNEPDLAAELFAEWAEQTKTLGFAVQVSTPVMTVLPSGGLQYSWSHFYSTWFYGDLHEAVGQGLAWVAEKRLKERQQAAAAKG